MLLSPWFSRFFRSVSCKCSNEEVVTETLPNSEVDEEFLIDGGCREFVLVLASLVAFGVTTVAELLVLVVVRFPGGSDAIAIGIGIGLGLGLGAATPPVGSLVHLMS